MEFLRFGSSIPGGYWGCCAMCIIQNFKFDPDAKASIQLVGGDGGNPIIKSGGEAFVGPTYRDIFNSRLRIGTFSESDMPNHVFLAVLTSEQISGSHGKKWLAILKENGFEFIRTTDNSVYTGPKTVTKPGTFAETSPHPNYLFGLFRNIGKGAIKDTLTPPKAWTDLPDPYSGDMSPDNVQAVQLKQWEVIGPAKIMTEAQLKAAGAPVILAGRRLPGAAPEPKEARLAREPKKASIDPFGKAVSIAPAAIYNPEDDYIDEEYG